MKLRLESDYLLSKKKQEEINLKRNIRRNAFTISFLLVFVIGFFIAGLYSKKINPNYPWYIEELNIPATWKKTKGENITIAVLDSGLDKELQKNLKSKIVKPYNFILENDNVDDFDGHGTSIISILSYENKGKEFYGISPKSKIMPLVVMNQGGRVEPNHVSEAIVYAVDNGADVINMSFGFKIFHEIIDESIKYAYERGVIMISAVGDNSDNKVLFPASSEKVIAVQAQSKYGGRYVNASWGKQVDIMIPGENINNISLFDDLNVDKSSGSSYSAAIMSGIVALKLSHKKESVELKYLKEKLKINTDKFLDVEKFVKKEGKKWKK